jgi:hypothetical protein
MKTIEAIEKTAIENWGKSIALYEIFKRLVFEKVK